MTFLLETVCFGIRSNQHSKDFYGLDRAQGTFTSELACSGGSFCDISTATMSGSTSIFVGFCSEVLVGSGSGPFDMNFVATVSIRFFSGY